MDSSELDRLLDDNDDWTEPQMVFKNIGIQPKNISNQPVQVLTTGQENTNQKSPKTPPKIIRSMGPEMQKWRNWNHCFIIG